MTFNLINDQLTEIERRLKVLRAVEDPTRDSIPTDLVLGWLLRDRDELKQRLTRKRFLPELMP